MAIAYFQTLSLQANSDNELGAALRQDFCSNVAPILCGRTEVQGVSVFSPAQAIDPYTDDGPPPELVFQITVADIAALDAILTDEDVRKLLLPPKGGSAVAEVCEIIAFDIEGIAEPHSRTAPLSFNIRYYAPVEDEKIFVDFYLNNHPPILAELPGIRNVFCYVPIADYANAPVALSNCILGNEVVFDTIEALNASMETDVRHRLREDYNAFPVKAGPNTHFAMLREDFKS
ncbi:MAG: hypothetical protein HON14_08465 [Rhodospirillaceae bacterium]|jgi:hypothetical protein|nr:hypothetical protein [Rhodospirillaceae bacterium]MBT4939149.1 hypothetical protein [Rhodospirillaceae bacterium]MBT5941972.1 hypothetical protein [Rhodospirillaceae bacterium]MBT7268377.1 hypothetical protein [Rhodospirillaceae bacterium]